MANQREGDISIGKLAGYHRGWTMAMAYQATIQLASQPFVPMAEVVMIGLYPRHLIVCGKLGCVDIGW